MEIDSERGQQRVNLCRWEILANVKLHPHLRGCVKNFEEDLRTVEYLRSTAVEAGIAFEQVTLLTITQGFDGRHCFIEDLSWNDNEKTFIDSQRNPVKRVSFSNCNHISELDSISNSIPGNGCLSNLLQSIYSSNPVCNSLH